MADNNLSGNLSGKNASARKTLIGKKRLVVKIGTKIITGGSLGSPDREHLKKLVKDIASFYNKKGYELILVSSGAIGAGMESLGLKERPVALAEKQMCASIGQAKLMSIYEELFSEFDIKVGQVLLTRDGLENEERSTHMKNTIFELFKNKALPIINENDVVSVKELCFGDNDLLAALLAKEIKADLLVLMTSSNGLKIIDDSGKADGSIDDASRISFLEGVSEKEFNLTKDTEDELSTGGMQSKLEAAKIVSDAGIWSAIIDGRNSSELGSLLEGKDVGTLIVSKN